MDQVESLKRIQQLMNEIGQIAKSVSDERDILRLTLLAIRDHITETIAYPETIAWVRTTVDGVVKE